MRTSQRWRRRTSRLNKIEISLGAPFLQSSAKNPMPTEILHAQVDGNRLRVENTWFSGATLFLNDQPIARNNHFSALNRSTPFMSAETTVNGSKSQIEIFAWAIFTVKIQIRLNGTIVAGEEL